MELPNNMLFVQWQTHGEYGGGSGNGRCDSSGESFRYGDGFGWPDGTGDAFLDDEREEFEKLKRVPELITEIRRANGRD